jgi:nucleoside permease NupC
VILGYLVLVTEWGSAVFLALGRCAEGFLAFSYQGSDFVFSSELSATAFIAFRMLPTIVFFSCVSSLLFYLGVV